MRKCVLVRELQIFYTHTEWSFFFISFYRLCLGWKNYNAIFFLHDIYYLQYFVFH